MAGETDRLAGFVAGLGFEDIPAEVVGRAKALTLDLFGSAIRARAQSDSTPALLAALKALGMAPDFGGECLASVAGDAHLYPPAAAALLNGALGHSLDFDDTHAASSLHPSAPVVPAALAAAEMVEANGTRLIAGIVAGYEVACRLGLALDPAAHYARGFHPTATAGTFGAAAAAARVFGLTPQSISSAFGIAGSQAAGSLQFLQSGAWNKRYQVGAAAMNGLMAATLAREGFQGAAEAIEGRHGFLAGYSDGADPAHAVAGLGSQWETMRIAVKPYPSCRYTHAALDALIALRAEYGLQPGQIEKVEVGLHRNGIALTAEPIEAKRRARNIVDGQFSMPFTGALALLQGSFGWDDYARLGEPQVEALAARFDVRRDAALEGRAHPFGGRVAVTLTSGERLERLVCDPAGEPESFPCAAMLAQKFSALARPVLGEAAEMLRRRIEALEGATDMRGLLRAPGPGAITAE
ncbi:MmgE/PrpD family protein [Afifella sp. IM 167]|uniref:MmgE/PrpD family protein n=1 Tax=Afifella sp. IM 167 TaxID=2033586 RepID=UPI001CCC0C0E|nr:MmgE/PrpD family protein [Afifella sp. IM 167]MBZ8133060.1 2-methylcitrate dehydratase [Afifella sp. IM 167]